MYLDRDMGNTCRSCGRTPITRPATLADHLERRYDTIRGGVGRELLKLRAEGKRLGG